MGVQLEVATDCYMNCEQSRAGLAAVLARRRV